VSTKLLPGKLPHDLLDRLLGRIPGEDPRVVLGSRIGADAAALEMGDEALVVTTDPITLAGDRIGWYAVHVNANDVATMGAMPRWFLATVMVPERGARESLVAGIFDELVGACRSAGVTLVGGHTEVTSAVTRPVVVGQMMGVVARRDLVDGRNLRPGHRIVLTGGIAIEGTAVLARELAGRLAARVPAALIERAAGYLDSPGISVVGAARVATRTVRVHAMHDPTEGGLATACHEMAWLAGVGLTIHGDRIPVLDECRAITGALDLEPLGLLSSGALLIGVEPDAADPLVRALEAAGIRAADIGEATDRPRVVELVEPTGNRRPMPIFARDELIRAFDA
jgi:hydrogenase maturation factor